MEGAWGKRTQQIKEELMLESFNTANLNIVHSLRSISIWWQPPPMSTTHAWIWKPCSPSQVLSKFRKERYLAHKLHFTRHRRLRWEIAPSSSDWAGISETQQICKSYLIGLSDWNNNNTIPHIVLQRVTSTALSSYFHSISNDTDFEEWLKIRILKKNKNHFNYC